MTTFDQQELKEIIQAVSSANNTDAMPAHSWARAAKVLLTEVERLREALEWYASYANWMDADPPDYNSRAAHDFGEKARRALEGKEVEE